MSRSRSAGSAQAAEGQGELEAEAALGGADRPAEEGFGVGEPVLEGGVVHVGLGGRGAQAGGGGDGGQGDQYPAINALKGSRAVATRYDKGAYGFHGTLTLAAIRLSLTFPRGLRLSGGSGRSDVLRCAGEVA